MRLSAPTVRAEVPWGGTQGRPQVPHEGGAPRRTAGYECPDGHKFGRVFALNAEVPVTWDCLRCGRTARLEGAAYLCEKGHPFSVPCAAGVTPPDTWKCKCGAVAHLKNAPEGTEGRPELPGYSSTSGGRSGVSQGDITPWGQLMKRRTKKQGKVILGEAEERARQARGAQ